MEEGPAAPRTSVVDWLFRDRQTGAITIAQPPNLPIWIFVGAWLLGAVVDPSGWPGTVLEVVRTLALATWAVLEVWSGVNPFRRMLGVGALAWIAGSLLAG
jgi:hypothetical protein